METKIEANGYEILKKCDRRGRQIKVHRLIVENFIRGQPIPGQAVHHIDGNRLNNNIDNLMVCSKAQHSIIHKIKRAIEAGGKQMIRCWMCKNHDLPENLYISPSGKNSYHRECKRTGSRGPYKRKE